MADAHGGDDERDERDDGHEPGDVEVHPEAISAGDVEAVGSADDEPGDRPAGVLARLRRLDRSLLVASLALAVGLVLIGLAVVGSVTGDEAADLPDSIEDITPAPDAVQVLQQTQVVVDLAEGYEGQLSVDGVALDTIRLDELAAVDIEPGEQVDVPPGAVFEPGNGTLTFTPGEGTAVEAFAPGSHTVSVVYWRTIEGRDAARTYGWIFEVV